MKIDAHQHFWRYNPRDYGWISDEMAALRRDFLPGELAEEQARVGFDGSIAVQARQTLEETEWLLNLACSSSHILGVVGWADLRSPDLAAQLAHFSGDPCLVGVRHVVQDEPDDRFLVRPDFQSGIAQLEAFGLAYDLLVFPRQLPAAIELVERFPRQRFVLDHIAKPPIRQGALEPWAGWIRQLGQVPNVACKLSGMVTEADWQAWQPRDLRPYLEVVFEAFGPGRLMIGSDWPVCTAAGDYGRVMQVVREYIESCSPEEQAGVLGENAQVFYRLKNG